VRRVGPYEVLDELGRGGAGVVWRVRDVRVGEELALKLLQAGDGAAGDRSARRFERQAEALTRLDHPGVVAVRAVGRDRGRPWIAMELVPGESLAERLRPELTDADAFRAAVARHSAAPNAGFGGVLGTFAPGVLEPELEAFLWAAEVGAVSEPLVREDAVLLLRRGERWAGCRLLLVDAERSGARARARGARARLDAGEPFEAVARALSDHADSAARGGDYRVFERGAQDRLLKRAVFEADPGERVGPLETPLGWVVAERADPGALARELREDGWSRVRALLVSHADAPGPLDLAERSYAQPGARAAEPAQRIRGGEDMAALAAEHDDDVDGRERRGDLGWIRRDGPATRAVVRQLFSRPPGELVGPLALPIGQLLLYREPR